MIALDRQLLFEARRFIDGANVHHVRELIWEYEQAVFLHNCGWPSQAVYNDRYELKLRKFVFQERMATLGADSYSESAIALLPPPRSISSPILAAIEQIMGESQQLIAESRRLIKRSLTIKNLLFGALSNPEDRKPIENG
jgi:hypothetical protein